ncbi:MAG: ASKHA domain-containing protein, partial [Lachnospiraceae bacterium]
MTEIKTNSFRKGSRCQVCTGCGRCFGNKRIDAVSSFFADDMSISGHFGQKQGYLVAVDIGTTTIAMQLRSLYDGKIIDTFSCINPQRNYGADVLSRIEAAEQPEAKEAMKQAVRGALEKGIRQFRRRLEVLQLASGICGMTIAANTTMIHLLMGYDVSRLGKHPFVPETLSEIRTELFGIDTVILPGASAFIGADIVAGVHALSMQERDEVTLLLDLGTNGEMVLGNKDRLIATGTAAGPAFEGNADCYGTDLMYLTAKLLEEGILDSTGLLADPYFESGIDIGGVHITQQYIRQLQMAKSAICTGIRILCKKYGLKDFTGIDRVWLAGGMGYYLNPQAAAAIGLIPQELADRTI